MPHGFAPGLPDRLFDRLLDDRRAGAS